MSFQIHPKNNSLRLLLFHQIQGYTLIYSGRNILYRGIRLKIRVALFCDNLYDGIIDAAIQMINTLQNTLQHFTCKLPFLAIVGI